MAELFGQPINRKQNAKYTGADWQTGSVRHLRFAGGPEDNTEVVQFDTGTGLVFNVIPSRGLDIASAKFCGAALAVEFPSGEAHPAHFDPQSIGWLQTFFGGLLTTCGMTWAGAPTSDGIRELGIHGRHSHLPARNLKIGDEWQGNRRRLWVSGDIRESMLFGPNVLCRRTISTELGSNTIVIEDTVRNEAFSKVPHQYLYHINLGYPLLDERAEFWANSIATPRDAEAEAGKEHYRRFDPPQTGYREKVYYHDIKPDRKGFCHVALVNTEFYNGRGLGVYLRYRKKEFPRFAQWKQMGAGEYVCGIEPANCKVEGRHKDEADGILVYMKPGEELNYYTEITVLPDNKAIQAIKKTVSPK